MPITYLCTPVTTFHTPCDSFDNSINQLPSCWQKSDNINIYTVIDSDTSLGLWGAENKIVFKNSMM